MPRFAAEQQDFLVRAELIDEALDAELDLRRGRRKAG
jgi:hypothetical protein